MMKRNFTPVQIIGMQRSGSNLLRLMLNELDGMIAPHPPHILRTFWPLVDKYGDLEDRANFELLIDDVCGLVETNPVVWENVVLDRARVLAKCREKSLTGVFHAIYDLMAQDNNSNYWCCKSMVNVKFAQAMEDEGVRPFYIHLVRDGRDVASSFRKVAVGDKHVYHIAKNWNDLQERSIALVKLLGPSRAMTIRYEDLIQHPEENMKAVCDLIGLPFSANVIKYFKSEESKHTADSGYMWGNLTKPIMPGNFGKYKNDLTNEEVQIFEAIAKESLSHFNYHIESINSDLKITSEMIASFDAQNKTLKEAILQKEHLKVDLMKRRNQQNHVESVMQRLDQSLMKRQA